MNRVVVSLIALLGAAVPLLLDSALKGAALLGLASVAALGLWKASAATRHLVWLVAVAALLVLPVLSAALPEWRVLPKWTAKLFGDAVATPLQIADEVSPFHETHATHPPPTLAPANASPTPTAPLPTRATSHISLLTSYKRALTWRDWLPLAWAAGAMLLALRVFAAHLLLCRAARRCVILVPAFTSDAITAAFASACAQLGIRRRVTLLLDHQRTIPVVWGVFHPRLLLPAEAREWSHEQLLSALLHELAHIRRRDTFVQWLTQIACALHWWNPLVWLAAWRLHVECERACDDLVLASGVRPSAYAEHLLNVATKLSPAGGTTACGLAMARQSSLEGRLLAVLSEKLNRRGVTFALAAAALLLGAGIAFPVAMLRAAEEKGLRKQPGVEVIAAQKAPEDGKLRAISTTQDSAEIVVDPQSASIAFIFGDGAHARTLLHKFGASEAPVAFRISADDRRGQWWNEVRVSRDGEPVSLFPMLPDDWLPAGRFVFLEKPAKQPDDTFLFAEIESASGKFPVRVRMANPAEISSALLRELPQSAPDTEIVIDGRIHALAKGAPAKVSILPVMAAQDLVGIPRDALSRGYLSGAPGFTQTFDRLRNRNERLEVTAKMVRGGVQVTGFLTVTLLEGKHATAAEAWRLTEGEDGNDPTTGAATKQLRADFSTTLGTNDALVIPIASQGLFPETLVASLSAVPRRRERSQWLPPSARPAIEVDGWVLSWPRADHAWFTTLFDYDGIPGMIQHLLEWRKHSATRAIWSEGVGTLKQGEVDALLAQFREHRGVTVERVEPFTVKQPLSPISSQADRTSFSASGERATLLLRTDERYVSPDIVWEKPAQPHTRGSVSYGMFSGNSVAALLPGPAAPDNVRLLLLRCVDPSKTNMETNATKPPKIEEKHQREPSKKAFDVPVAPVQPQDSQKPEPREMVPAGAGTGQRATSETRGVTDVTQPKHESARSLLQKWQASARTDGKLPGAQIARLAGELDGFLERYGDQSNRAPLKAIRARMDASRDWTIAETVALLDEITAIATAPVSWCELEEAFAAMHNTQPGKPLPDELKNAAWGAPAPNGLRVAWKLEPTKDAYALGETAKCRVLFHNTGVNVAVFVTDTWHQHDGWKARDAADREIPVKTTWYTGITPTERFRIEPGEYVEVAGHGVGIGAVNFAEEYSVGSIGAEIHAKPGDEVRVSWSVRVEPAGWGVEKGEPSEVFRKRLEREGPPPKEKAERELFLRRVTLDLLGVLPTAQEIAAFVADESPDATAKLLDRLLASPANVPPWDGALETGEVRFRVVAADPEAAKKPRTATGTGRFQLTPEVRLQVTQITGGGRAQAENFAMLQWAQTPELPALQYRIDLPEGDAKYIFAWRRGKPVVWVADGREIRKISFADPARVITDMEGIRNNFGRDFGLEDEIKTALGTVFTIGRDNGNIGGNGGGQTMGAAEPQEAWVIEGTVTGADGKPMAGVEVTAHEEWRTTKVLAKAATDADGRYKLSFHDDLEALANFRGIFVAAKKPGFAEKALNRSGEFALLLGTPGENAGDLRGFRPLTLGEAGRADFTLLPAAAVEGRLVGTDGKPLAEYFAALRSPEQRRGYSAASATTDAEGRFRFDDVPLQLRLEFLIGKNGQNLAASQPRQFSEPKSHTIELRYETDGGGRAQLTIADNSTESGIRISVVNQRGGNPLGEFRVIGGVKSGVSSDVEGVVNWQPHTLRIGKNGALIWPLEKAYDDMALRVEAEGFLPQTSGWIKKSDGAKDVSFALAEDPGIEGQVLTPDGKPAAGATLALAMVQRDAVIESGKLRGLGEPLPEKPGDRWRRPVFAQTDAEGRFHVPHLADPTAATLILHESGVRELPLADLAKTPELTLQPWGRIEGRVVWQDRPGADEEISLTIHRDAYGYPGVVAQYEKTTSDADGRFVFENVLPGRVQLSRAFAFPAATKSGTTSVTLPGMFAHVTVKSGAPTAALIGGRGRTVKGRLTGRDSWSGAAMHFHPRAPHIGMPEDEDEWKAWSEFQQGALGPLFFRSALKANADGTFAIANVLPGDYQLFIDGDAGYRQFSVESEEAEAPAAALDLGQIAVTPAQK